jgi:hypothetical protein
VKGPEVKGTLRRDWRYDILAIIADEDGNYSPDTWNRLNERVGEIIVEAKREELDGGQDEGRGPDAGREDAAGDSDRRVEARAEAEEEGRGRGVGQQVGPGDRLSPEGGRA